jgi:RsiW-degrading membrane proteinase PrsW (M82 family)
MESPASFPSGRRPGGGLIVSFIVSALAGFGLSFAVQTPLLPAVGIYALAIVFAPLTEEVFKTSGMFVVAYLMWKTVPNRRYGAALGAAAGLGFGILESILYIYGIATTSEPSIAAARTELIVLRACLTPLMHPLWSAFVGIGVFALLSGRSERSSLQKSSSWLPWFFLLVGIGNHMVWNGISFGFADSGYLPIILNVIVTFPVFALVLRDFLGGHFNFQNFFETIPEPTTAFPPMPPPPPPPPP